MTSNRPTAETIFHDAMELEEEVRPAFLDDACGDDQPLRREVDDLLADYTRAQDFLERPAAVVAAATLPTDGEHPGSQIGPYQLLEEIGKGGFGVVYRAEQREPVRRKVALKVIKPGMDTREVVARFEAERQALAMMDHPSIAHVLDAGATEHGRPYFVMELVHGESITKYCDQRDLSMRERLELFVLVCHAVQHAHQKGIIHRDIKPSNILVAIHDDAAVPKVIDFGIAKAVNEDLARTSAFTAQGQVVGTPLYMSPEQAEVGRLDIDTRSDVYSLGVLLYELLTGTTPFDKERLNKAGLDEVRRVIREEEPVRPSTRISTLGRAATTMCEHRQTDPTRLRETLRQELDWVVMKALEKDRTRRYETANAFARDIERYLHDEAVEACPPSRLYRLGKFARRHRAAVISVSAVLLSTMMVLVAITIAALSRSEAADRQRQLADQRAQVQRGINDALTEVARLRGQTDQNGESALTKAREQAQRALALAEAGPADPSLVAEVQQLAEELDQEQRERQLLAALDKAWLAQADMVDTFFNTRASNRLVREALEAYGIRVGTMPTEECAAIVRTSSPAVRSALLAALHEWYTLLRPLSGIVINTRSVDGGAVIKMLMPDSAPARDGRLHAGDRIVGVGFGSDEPIVNASAMRVAETRKLLSLAAGATARLQVVSKGGNDPQILEISRDPVADQLQAVLDAADQDGWRQRLRMTCNVVDVGKRCTALQELAEEAEIDKQPVRVLVHLANELKVLETTEKAIGLLREVWKKHPNDLGTNLKLALTLKGECEPPRLEEAVRYYTAAIALRPDSYGLRINLGVALVDLGRIDEGIAQYQESLRIRPGLAIAHANLAHAMRLQGKLDEAFAECQKALRIDSGYAIVHNTLGLVFQAQGRLDDAVAEYGKALRIDPDYLAAHGNLANVLADQGRLEEAMIEHREALRINPDDATIHRNMGLHLLESGQAVEAAIAFREALRIDPNEIDARIDLGMALAGQGKLEEAIAEYRDVIRRDRNNVRTLINLGQAFFDLGRYGDAKVEFQRALQMQPDLAVGHHNLGQVYLRQGRPDEAVNEFRAALQLQPNDASAHSGVALGLGNQGKLKEAITAYREAIRIDPNYAQAHGNLGTTFFHMRRWDEAIAEFREFIRLRPDLAIAHGNLANAYLAKGRFSEAMAEYREAVRLDPNNAGIRINMARALADQRKQAEAIAEYREVLRIQPNHAEVHNNLAWLLATLQDGRLQQPEQAVNHATKATSLSPKLPPFWNTLGVAHYRNGQWSDALEALTKSVELGEGGNACDWLFLAMAHWQMDQKEDARRWYDKATQWMNENESAHEELLRFRKEATDLLGTGESSGDKRPVKQADDGENKKEKSLTKKDEPGSSTLETTNESGR